MYHLTWVFQFLTLLLGNMGFILLGGKALKVIKVYVINTVYLERTNDVKDFHYHPIPIEKYPDKIFRFL